MILNRSCFIGPTPPIFSGSKYINVVNHTRLTWSTHIDHIKKSFTKKVGALRRMKNLPSNDLEEIYFQSIIPAVTHGLIVWGNCSPALMASLNPIHARAARLIHRQGLTADDRTSLQILNWLLISYFYKRRLLFLINTSACRHS